MRPAFFVPAASSWREEERPRLSAPFPAAIRGDGKLAVIWPPRRKASENGLEQVGSPLSLSSPHHTPPAAPGRWAEECASPRPLGSHSGLDAKFPERLRADEEVVLGPKPAHLYPWVG